MDLWREEAVSTMDRDNEGNNSIHHLAIDLTLFAYQQLEMLVQTTPLENMLNSEGMTPLDIAIRSNNTKAVEILVVGLKLPETISETEENWTHDLTLRLRDAQP
jgi:hypothetical protein